MKLLSKIVGWLRSEPALLMTFAGSGISLASSFGLHLNLNETKAVYSAVAALTAVALRQSVVPSARIDPRLAAVETAIADLQAAAGTADPLTAGPQSIQA